MHGQRIVAKSQWGPMSRPRISIITVVKDDLVGLIRTHRSLASQSSQEFEWVVIDSSEPEQLGDKLGKNAWKTSYYWTPPKGIYSAMNLGAARATAPWLWFINAGDFLLSPRSIEDAIDAVSSSVAGLVGSPVEVVTSDGYLLDVVAPKKIEIAGKVQVLFHHQGTLIYRHAFEDFSGYCEGLKYAADGELLDRIGASWTTQTLDTRLVGFVSGGRASRAGLEIWREISTYRSTPSTLFLMKTVAFQSLRNLLYTDPLPGFLDACRRQLLRTREQRVMRFASISSRAVHYSDHESYIGGGVRRCCVQTGQSVFSPDRNTQSTPP